MLLDESAPDMVQFGEIPAELILLPRWQKEARFQSENGLQLPISTERNLMISHEEVKITEREIRHLAKEEIPDGPSLRKILKQAVPSFEESLKALSSEDREAALSLYLQKIREVTFVFHLAILRLATRNDALTDLSQVSLDALLERHAEEVHSVARLYKLP